MNAESSPDKQDQTDDDGLQEYPTAAGWLAGLREKLGLSGPQTLRATLEDALKQSGSESEDAFSAEEREMLARLLRFGSSRVEDIMVPRADIVAVEESDTIGNLIKTFEHVGVSRVPVFKETLDDPHGMIHVKDLFRWLLADAANQKNDKRGAKTGQPTDNPSESDGTATTATAMGGVLNGLDLDRKITIAKIRRPILFVPPSMPAMNLLIRMQSTRRHMALVVDEYGGTDGLVTIEDLVEQVVGEIEDEHDEAEVSHITRDPKLGLTAAARTPVAELEEFLGRKLLSEEDEEDIDTLGGLVFAIVGRVPVRGELVRHASGLEFEVLDADPRRVKKLKIHVGRPKSVEEDRKPQQQTGGAKSTKPGREKAKSD